jgi:hypothetical protein
MVLVCELHQKDDGDNFNQYRDDRWNYEHWHVNNCVVEKPYELSLMTNGLKGLVPKLLQLMATDELPTKVTVSPMI